MCGEQGQPYGRTRDNNKVEQYQSTPGRHERDFLKESSSVFVEVSEVSIDERCRSLCNLPPQASQRATVVSTPSLETA